MPLPSSSSSSALASETSVFMLATSTETYRPMSDRATTASIALSHHDDADRLLPSGDRGGDQDAESLAFLQPIEAAARTQRRSKRRDFVERAPDLLEDGGDGIALPHRNGALVPAVAAGGLDAGLRQQRDVLGDNARLEARVGVGRAVGGIGQRRAAAGRQARDLIAVLRAARRPIGGVAHARDDV